MIGLYGRANCKNVSRIFCFFVRINGLFDSRRRDRNLFIFVWKLYCRNVFLLKNISSHLILGGMTDISKLICRDVFFYIVFAAYLQALQFSGAWQGSAGSRAGSVGEFVGGPSSCAPLAESAHVVRRREREYRMCSLIECVLL